MKENVTNDLSQFGYRELEIAKKLLSAYQEENGTDFLTTKVQIYFNMESGYVFLSDEEYNVGVQEDGKLVQLFTCPNCGYEGTQQQALEDKKDFEKHKGFCSQKCETA